MCAADRLTYTDVKERLNLSDEDVLRLLHSLSMAKYKILGKEPNNKVLTKTDTFFFNSKFTSPMRRIRVRSQTWGGSLPCICCQAVWGPERRCSVARMLCSTLTRHWV